MKNPRQGLSANNESTSKRISGGLIVAFLGPDGSGKSSVISLIAEVLSGEFAGVRVFHLRSWRVGRTSGPVTNPHGAKENGVVLSTIKAFIWCLAYILEHMRTIQPLKGRGSLVLFDRYYHDLLVDPTRYRYGGPRSLPWLLSWVTPKPDLFVVMDAPPEILQSRKQEVPFDESKRQREAYRAFAARFAPAVVVDASLPLTSLTAITCELIRYVRESVR